MHLLCPGIYPPMQWFYKESGDKYSASQQHKCGGLQILRHKFVDQSGAKSTVAVSIHIPILTGLESPTVQLVHVICNAYEVSAALFLNWTIGCTPWVNITYLLVLPAFMDKVPPAAIAQGLST